MHELHTCTLGALWDPGRELLWNCYQGLEPGREHFGTVERRDLRMTKDVNVAGAVSAPCCAWPGAGPHGMARDGQGLGCSTTAAAPPEPLPRLVLPTFVTPWAPPLLQLGFLSSWSAYNTYKRQHPDGPDPLNTFHGLLLEAAGPEEAAGADSPEPVLRLDWHVFMILARDPVPPQAGA